MYIVYINKTADKYTTSSLLKLYLDLKETLDCVIANITYHSIT